MDLSIIGGGAMDPITQGLKFLDSVAQLADSIVDYKIMKLDRKYMDEYIEKKKEILDEQNKDSGEKDLRKYGTLIREAQIALEGHVMQVSRAIQEQKAAKGTAG